MTEERIIAYLLKELPEDKLEQFEDECFAGESWPVELNLVEEDLIDAYLRRKLTQEQHKSFEQNYLTTEARHDRVAMAAAFLRHTDEHNAALQIEAASKPVEASQKVAASERLVATAPAQTGPTWAERFGAFWASQSWGLRAAAIVAVAAVTAGALWLLVARQSQPTTFATLNLTMSVNNRAEGVEAAKVKLPLPADALRIFLRLPEATAAAESYRVEMENADGQVKRLEMDGRDAQSISVVIPASKLARGRYVLKLFQIKADGTEQRIAGNYFFDVE